MKSALLFGVGSAGDVFPFIALGKGLAARGWQVSLCANPTFKEQVIRAGLAFEPLGTREHYDRITRDPNLWHPRKGTRTILADFQAMDMIRTQRDLARHAGRIDWATQHEGRQVHGDQGHAGFFLRNPCTKAQG